MPETVAPPLVDAVVANMLADNLLVAAGTKVPKTRPASFIRVLLTGGAGRSAVAAHRATVVVESWAASAAAAANLAAQVDAFMLAGHEYATEIRRVTHVGAPTYFPDATSGSERYTATYEVTVRALALP